MIAQLPEDLVHLERGEDGLDQHRRLDRSLRDPELVLRRHEDLVPEARLEMALDLRQVEVGAGAAREQLLRVVEHEEREVEDAAVDSPAVDGDVLLVEVPAARAHLQRRDLVVEPVASCAGRSLLLERQRAPDRLADVDLALDLVGPERRVRILEVGHVRIRARVEGVDDHLRVDRPGDLDAAALQRRRHRRDLPVAGADVGGLGEEVGTLAGVEPLGALVARREQLLAARVEVAVQPGDELERGPRQDGLEAGQDRGVDLHAGREVEVVMARVFRKRRKRARRSSCVPMRVGRRAELVERQAEAVDPERRVAEPGRADRVPAVARDEEDVAGRQAERAVPTA